MSRRVTSLRYFAKEPGSTRKWYWYRCRAEDAPDVHTVYNSTDDVQWLFDTHVTPNSKLADDWRRARSFGLVGNEDSPDYVVLYRVKSPRLNNWCLVLTHAHQRDW